MNELNVPYLFLGFNLFKISFQRNQNEELNDIKISIYSDDFDEEDNTFSLGIKVVVDFESSKGNEFIYISGFRILDESLRDDLKNNKNDDYLAFFVSSVYPFIRESIANITKDSGKNVMLPTIDCRMISFSKTLVLSVKK